VRLGRLRAMRFQEISGTDAYWQNICKDCVLRQACFFNLNTNEFPSSKAVGHLHCVVSEHRLRPSCSLTIRTEVVDNFVSYRVVESRVCAVGTIRLLVTVVDFLWSLDLMSALAVFRAWSRLKTHLYEK
jgi:hypothetical protein